MPYTRTRRALAAAAGIAAIAGLALAPAAVAKHSDDVGNLAPAAHSFRLPAATPTGTASINGHTYAVTGGTWTLKGLQVDATLNTSGGPASVVFNVGLVDGQHVKVETGSTFTFGGHTYSVTPGGVITAIPLLPQPGQKQQVYTTTPLATSGGPLSFNLSVV